MRLLAGTSGYSFKEWRGTFYPETTRPDEMLGLYAARLPAVEINNTYYRLPKASVVANWAESVPEGFRFAIKASRRITHFKRLKGAEDEVDYLFRTLAHLGDRLGAVLFQLPPNLPADVARLERFVDLLPAGAPGAFEFRHASWDDDPRVDAALHARGMVRVLTDGDSGLPISAASAAQDWGYLRLREDRYDREALAKIASQLVETAWTRGLAFFKHEDGCAGATQSEVLMELCERIDARRPAIAVGRPLAEKRAGER